jgi:hypothetical protein
MRPSLGSGGDATDDESSNKKTEGASASKGTQHTENELDVFDLEDFA